MGANTYRLMSGFAAGGEPGTDALGSMSKVVFSTTLTEPVALDMISSRTFDGRIQLLEYVPTILAGPATR
jgi:hypothetical protein